VTSAEVTAEPIVADNVQITGGSSGFTQAQANGLADALKYGSLPLDFQQLTENNVSAQLGHSSLVAGLTAGVIGLSLVTIDLFAYYRGLGVVAVSSLLLAALLAYLSVVLLSRYQNFTMSLSAIAGLVVAIGITADSFIVYFERLRDAIRDGTTLRPAAESGLVVFLFTKPMVTPARRDEVLRRRAPLVRPRPGPAWVRWEAGRFRRPARRRRRGRRRR
jgi:preprotein translocase subunit SecD